METSGKENGNYDNISGDILRVYGDIWKENGNCCSGLYRI